jgi:uncharacterized phosphosugar-binding protein
LLFFFINQIETGEIGQGFYEAAESPVKCLDIFIDNHLPLGDAIIGLPGMAQKMGSTSTFANCFTINLLMMQIAQELLDEGIMPATWQSANMPDGDRLNKKYEDELLPKMPK